MSTAGGSVLRPLKAMARALFNLGSAITWLMQQQSLAKVQSKQASKQASKRASKQAINQSIKQASKQCGFTGYSRQSLRPRTPFLSLEHPPGTLMTPSSNITRQACNSGLQHGMQPAT